ncbi:hypothetical protein cyc_05454 [Cyclospora cayetanensis]|uniref:Uncharacterized protein n=1 Tax=Cyclospora cayetanensis TaxID=88456 RepID=A0A1D3CVU6_9EIME|nr:hypothetical protein cyc_05454 [Cyclospora cayetanensis]
MPQQYSSSSSISNRSTSRWVISGAFLLPLSLYSGSGISHSRLAALSAQQKQQQQKKEKEIVQRRRANQEKQRQRLLQQKEERRQAKKSRQQQQHEQLEDKDQDEEMHARLWGRWDDPPLSEDEFLEAFGVDASSLEDKEEAAEGAPAPSGSSKSGAKKKKGGGKGSGVASSGSACDGDAQQLPQDLSSMDLPEPANYAEAVEAAAEAEQRAMAAIRVAGASRSVAESAALLLPHLEGECLERATEASQDIGRRKPGDKYTLVPVEGMPPLEALPIFRQPRSRAAGKAAKGVEAVAAASTAAAAAKAAAAEAALGAPPPAACTPFPLVKVLVLTPDRIIPPASVSLLAKLPDRKSLTARLLETFLTPTFRLLSAVQYAPRLLSASLRAKQQQLLGILRLCCAEGRHQQLLRGLLQQHVKQKGNEGETS